jgi:hypothetical protein
VQNGVVEPGTRVELRASSAAVASERGSFAGSANLTLTAPQGDDTLRVQLAAPEIRGVERPGGIAGPTLRDVDAELVLAPRRLSQPLRVESFSAGVPRADAPALAWFEPWLGSSSPRLSGSARFDARASRGPDQAYSLALDLHGRALGIATKSFGVQTNASLRVRASREAGRKTAQGDVSARLEQARLTHGRTTTAPFDVSVRAGDLRTELSSPARMDGDVHVTARRVDSLVPLVVGFAPLRDVLIGTLGIADLQARAALRVNGADARLDLLSARSGALSARGYATIHDKRLSSKLLLKTKVANVGVEHRNGETSVSPLVSDDWLEPTSRTRAPARHGAPRTRSTRSADPNPPASPRATGTLPRERAPKRLSASAR